MQQLLAGIGGIVLVDQVLRWDSALVIGAAASTFLPFHPSTPPPLYGPVAGRQPGDAAAFRLSSISTLLRRLPILHALGGAALLLVAIWLLSERTGEQLDEEAVLIPTPQHYYPTRWDGLVGVLLTTQASRAQTLILSWRVSTIPWCGPDDGGGTLVRGLSCGALFVFVCE